MTEKRFTVEKNNKLLNILDNGKRIGNTYHVCALLNFLEEENEQLKKRNQNQYDQLTKLWELIENEDYNMLRSMLNQLKEDERQLQNEWKTYGEINE